MRAFTLVETLVSILVFSVIVMSIFLVITIGQHSWNTADPAVELRQQIILALITINSELSETSSGKTNLTADVAQSSIQFKIPYDNNSDGIILSTEWSSLITYSLDSSNELVRTYGGVSSILAQDIKSLSFTNISSNLIQVDITAQKTNNLGKVIQDTEQAIIKMRN